MRAKQANYLAIDLNLLQRTLAPQNTIPSPIAAAMTGAASAVTLVAASVMVVTIALSVTFHLLS